MGIVYEAERQSLRSHVALKVLHPWFRSDAVFLSRFHNEARSAARLHHTNIVSVFDFGEQGGILYYAMQYIPGQGLNRVLDDVRRLRGVGLDPSSVGPVAAPAPTVNAGLMTGRFPTGPATPEDPGDEATITVAPSPDVDPEAGPRPVAGEPWPVPSSPRARPCRPRQAAAR
jgi:hypothetical protein